MFDKKYNKALKLLDMKIDFTQEMFDIQLREAGNTEGLTDKEIYDNMMSRNGKWKYVDASIAKLEALCELRRELKKEIGL